MNLAETIKEITREHLENNNGMLLGQAISAVGWVNGTVPDCKNVIELPMTDVAGAGFAVGAALVGRRPIFVLRFQDFIILNGSQIFNYAAKTLELHGVAAPIFVRCIGTDSAGPVHSGIFHNIAMNYPGIYVCAPMSPGEYKDIWNVYMNHDMPMYVSEHRRGYLIEEEMHDVIQDKAEITLYGISDARMNMVEAAKKLEDEGIKVNVIHVHWLKPLHIEQLAEPLLATKRGLVIDSGYEICGASRSIAYELSEKTGYFVDALGLKDNIKCLCEPLANKTPTSEQIYEKVKSILKR